jgi:hypothetical protein
MFAIQLIGMTSHKPSCYVFDWPVDIASHLEKESILVAFYWRRG